MIGEGDVNDYQGQANGFFQSPEMGHNGGPALDDEDDLPEITIRPELNNPQMDFLECQTKFKAFVAGFGSGKTFVGCGELCEHALKYPGINSGYFAPTYTHIADIFWPTIEEVAPLWGLRTEILKAAKIVKLYEVYKDKKGKTRRKLRGKIFCRSMDNPNKIVGFKIGQAVVDEIDTMPQDKAKNAWRKIIARMRYKLEGLKNGISVTTTPEGFKFIYNQFVKEVRDNPKLKDLYAVIHASTYDNAKYLPDDYISSLYQSYPPQLIEAYLNGQFVNLNSGAVYPCFDRFANASSQTILAGEPLHIGMDFNVNKMAAIVHVLRGGIPHAVAELTGIRDTPAMIEKIVELWPKRQINIYPDASGQNTSSKNASLSDLSLLRAAKFNVFVNNSNPRVKDRVLSMNTAFMNGKGESRYFVNVDSCPTYAESLEQQAYDEKTGEPDKKSGHDHANDAGGYFITYRFPVVKTVLVRRRVSGV